ncbi:MAG TPA: hypothetical protein VFH78_15135 [Candidatus Thermoplasmatota archaeon]|nr:hypothetical protein [Candidatus Thermoplasmatota archaeon]
MVVPSEAEALAFLERGELPEGVAPRDMVRASLKVPAFKAKVWPHFACFVDASNVARRRPVPAHEVNTPKARLADLDAVVEEARRLRYVPIVVSDANLFQLIDEPYEWQRKYSQYPHSVAKGRQADTIVLRALEKLPEGACVTNDRFAKPDERRDFAHVLDMPDTFYRHAWDAEAPRLVAPDGSPMPHAHDRLARRLLRAADEPARPLG